MHFVSYIRRSGKILILNKEGIIEKNSYDRDKSLFFVRMRRIFLTLDKINFLCLVH